MRRLLIFLTTLTTIGVGAFAQERANVDSAILSMRTFGPVGAGSVTPDGARNIHEAGDEVIITATANSGFAFTSWSVNGLATLADDSAANTSVVLNGNAVVTANFVDEGDEVSARLSLAPSSDDGGTVDPAETELKIGEKRGISAKPNASHRFVKWNVEGPAVLDNIHASDTNVVIRGAVEITAEFSEAEDCVSLTVATEEDEEGGEVADPGVYHVKKGGNMIVRAYPAGGHVFTGWLVEGVAVIASENAAQTTVTPYEDTTVTATFAAMTCSFSHRMRKIHIRKTDAYDGNVGYVHNRDRVKVKNLPMCLNPNDFNPNTDTCVVIIDGNTFTIDAEHGHFKRYRHGYRYKSFDRHNEGGPMVKFSLDFTRGVWSFRATKINLDRLDAIDGVDVTLYVNGNYFGKKYDMEEQLHWNFNITKNAVAAADCPGTDFDAYTLRRLNGRSTNFRDDRDKIVVVNADLELATDQVFPANGETISLNIGDESLVIPAESFEEIDADVFEYKDKELGILLKFDFANKTWSLRRSNFNGWGNLDPNQGLKVYLEIGDSQSGLSITPSYRRILKYNYLNFYWRR